MGKNKHTMSELYQWQSLPLSIKVSMTKRRIRDWVNYYGEDGVYISFSGGKDSTVLLHLAREMYPNIKACFVDTGLEYAEIRQFVKTFDNVDIIKPKMGFKQVCEKYGFPLISKEVSECVYGARKYLTSILEEQAHLNERTNERTMPNHTYMADILGIDRRINKENPDYLALKTGVTLSTLAELAERKHIEATRGGATTSTTTSVIESLEQSEELAKILNQRMLNRTGGNNQRLAIMLGMLTRDPKNPIKANIPSNDKSQFSQERWKFFLNADFEISNKCCSVMKKEPVHRYNKETGRMPITAQMASESRLRTQKWLENGCNAFDLKRPISNPMSFWTEQDVLLYIKTNNIPIASVYGDVVVDYAGMGQLDGQMSIADYMTATEKEEFDLDRPLLKTTGCTRTGCIVCGFGCHLDKGESRFERLKKTHPKAYHILDVVKNNGVTYREAIDWINENNGKGKIIRY